MVQRQRETRPQYANLPLPVSFEEACQRVQFIAGTPGLVARDLVDLRRAAPFSAFHIQPRWQRLEPAIVEQTIRLFKTEVLPLVGEL
jgi:hypothetical protein